MDGNDNVRLKEKAKHGCARKKRRTDSGSPMKRRNLKRKLKEQPDIVGTLKFYTKSEQEKLQIFNKIDQCKLIIGEKIPNVSNAQCLIKVLDFFINSHGAGTSGTNHEVEDEPAISYSQYLKANRNETDEEHFLVTKSA